MSKYVPAIVTGIVVAVLIGGGLGFFFASNGIDPGALPIWTGFFVGGFTAFIMANLAGTKLGKAATPEQKAEALSFKGRPGEATVIIARHGVLGMAAGVNISVDGKVRAQLKSPRFTVLTVPAGEHELGAAFGGLAGKQNKPVLVSFVAREGDVLAFRTGTSMGMLQNKVMLERVEDFEALHQSLSTVTMVQPEPA